MEETGGERERRVLLLSRSVRGGRPRRNGILERVLMLRMSVVIPAWNEELWLPRLLRSLQGCPQVSEIIVADNDSEDATVRVARSYGCRVVSGGRPARARNNGALHAGGDILLFLDADAVIEPRAVAKLLRHFERPEIAAVHCRLEPIDASPFVRVCYGASDVYFRAVARLGGAQAIGSCMIVRRESFVKAGGFREEVAVGEDADLYRRLRMVGKVTYDRSARVKVSARRFAIENPVIFAGKCMVWAALRMVGSSRSLVAYRWTGYPASVALRENQLVPGVTRMPASATRLPAFARRLKLARMLDRRLAFSRRSGAVLDARLQPVPRRRLSPSSASTIRETISMKVSALRK